MEACLPSVSARPAGFRRLLVLGPVLLLHIALLIALLHMNWGLFIEAGPPANETVFFLKPVPLVPNYQGELLPSFGRASIAVPPIVLPALPTYRNPAANQQAIASELKGVGRALFRCWPANSYKSAEVQDAQCLTFPSLRLPNVLEPPEQARSADVWRRELKRRNAPFLVPCWSGISLATIGCVANGLANGFDLDDQPGYAETEDEEPMNGTDTIRHDMQTVDPCALDNTYGFGFVCLYRVANGNKPP